MSRSISITAILIVGLLALAMPSCTKKGTNAGAAGTDRYNHGIGLLEAGDYKGAIVEFDAALRADPNNFEAVKNLAGAYVEEEQWQQAREQYAKAQTMRPDDPSIYANLSYVYQHLGAMDMAWEMVNTAKQKDANYALTYYRMGEMYLLEGKKTQAAAAFKDYIRLEPNSRLAKDAASLMNAGPAPGAAQNKPVSTVKPEDAVKPNGQNPATPATPNKPATNPPGQHPAQPPAGQHPAQPPAAHGATPAHPAAPAHQPPAQVKPPEPPPPPPLTGDALYEDRLSRGRQARAIGDADNAVNLLKEAYGVHPDYSQVNYELGLAYIAASDPCDGKKYLERYLQLETDADAKAQAQEKLNGVVCDEPDN